MQKFKPRSDLIKRLNEHQIEFGRNSDLCKKVTIKFFGTWSGIKDDGVGGWEVKCVREAKRRQRKRKLEKEERYRDVNRNGR